MRLNLLVGFTALVLASQAATVGETDRFIPLVQDGGGWSTQITIVNLSDKTATVVLTLMTAKAFTEPWKVDLKATQGRVFGFAGDAVLAPGAVTTMETSGTPELMTRGFAEIVELNDLPFGAVARLIKRENGKIVHSFTVPLCPSNETKSMIPLDLTGAAGVKELVWVSPTNSTTLDLTFRQEGGEVLLEDVLTFNGLTQIFVSPLERWPQLAGFRGTVEWKVTYPAADRYEYRFLSSVSIWSFEGQSLVAVPSMTLRRDQRDSSPY